MVNWVQVPGREVQLDNLPEQLTHIRIDIGEWGLLSDHARGDRGQNDLLLEGIWTESKVRSWAYVFSTAVAILDCGGEKVQRGNPRRTAWRISMDDSQILNKRQKTRCLQSASCRTKGI